MGDGYVYQTIAAPITGVSYKLAEPGTLQGMIVGDRTDGITGRLGPVEAIAGTATADRTPRGAPTSTVTTTLAPDDRTAPIVAALLQDEPAIRVTDGLARGTMTLRVADQSPGAEAARSSTATSTRPRATWSRSRAAQAAPDRRDPAAERRPAGPDLGDHHHERLETAVRAARIVGARIAPRRVAAGGRRCCSCASSRGARRSGRSGCRCGSPTHCSRAAPRSG